MADQQDWENLFKNDKFVNNYKTGEHITGHFAQSLLDQSGLVTEANSNPSKPLVVLDNACGTGIVSSILHDKLDDAVKATWKLTCGDISPGMIEYTRRRMDRESWQNAEVRAVDAQDTKLPSDHFTHVVTAFAYMALPKPFAALDDTTRILRPGGTIAFTTWIEPGWVSVVGEAIKTIPGDLPYPTSIEMLSILGKGEFHSVSWIQSQLQERGFVDINVKVETKPISLKSFWTEQQREESFDKVRPALQKYLVNLYGNEGYIPMEWTAILSTARKSNSSRI